MKEIKIFLASSEEMDYDRQAFGNLVRRLDNLYEKRGIRVKLFEWEDYDSAYNDRRKQDEYNDRVRESDVFLALFHRKAGSFTVEEFDVASEQFRKKASPKVYTFLKDLKPEDMETPELKDFKKRLFEELGHFWCRYDSRDSLQFQFIMQLQLVESSMQDDLKVEGSDVTLEGIRVASMDKLSFAARNEEYVRMSEKLSGLPEKIEKARLRLEKFPDDADLQDDLQQKLNRYNDLKETLDDYRHLLFETAKRVARLQKEKITERLRRAMEAFNEGKVHEANVILNEAEADAKASLEEFRQTKELAQIRREKVKQCIGELWFKTSVVMAEVNQPVDTRIEDAQGFYRLAIDMAEEIEYKPLKYARLLSDYGRFLSLFSKCEDALRTYQKVVDIMEKELGQDHPDTATAYNDVGVVYSHLGNYSKAFDFYSKGLSIRENVLPSDHPDLARSYNNLGGVYFEQGNYVKALEYGGLALSIYEKIYGEEHADTAGSYNNLGVIYHKQKDYDQALHYYNKALKIRKKMLGSDHLDTATSYHNIGALFAETEQYAKALDCLEKALSIREYYLGLYSLDTANTYDNIGGVYSLQNMDKEALPYLSTALDIREKIGSLDHEKVASSSINLGLLFEKQKEFLKAEQYYSKALPFYEKELGDAEKLAYLYSKLGELNKELGNLTRALEFYEKSACFFETIPNLTEEKRRDFAVLLSSIGTVCINMGDITKAKESFQIALGLFKELKEETWASYYSSYGAAMIGWGCIIQDGELDEAQSSFEQAYAIYEKYGDDSTNCATQKISALMMMTVNYVEKKEYDSAIEICHKVLSVCKGHQDDLWTRTLTAWAWFTIAELQKEEVRDVEAAKISFEKGLAIARSLKRVPLEKAPNLMLEKLREQYIVFSEYTVDEFLSSEGLEYTPYCDL